jgi:predicted permease
VAAFFVRNPPLFACVLGFLAPAALAPDWAVDASQIVVFAILPLGFFVVGVTLAAEAEEGALRFPPRLSPAVGVALALKLLVAPAIVLGLSQLVLAVPDPYLVQAAMASAINAIVIAHEYGLDRGLVAATIAWSTAIVVAAGLAVPLVG